MNIEGNRVSNVDGVFLGKWALMTNAAMRTSWKATCCNRGHVNCFLWVPTDPRPMERARYCLGWLREAAASSEAEHANLRDALKGVMGIRLRFPAAAAPAVVAPAAA